MMEIPDLPYALVFPNWLLQRKPRFPTINQPIWCNAPVDYLQPDDLIVGLYMAKKAYTIPWEQIERPHTANMVLDNKPVMVSVCSVSSSVAAYHPLVQGKHYTFHASGIYCGSSIISDQETGSIWSPLTGVALAGDCLGNTLERLPLVLCTWAEWVQMHPDTLVLAKADSVLKPDHLPGDPMVGSRFRQTLPNGLDHRLPHNMLVLSVAVDGGACAYPLPVLSRVGIVLNDRLGETDLVIFHKPGFFYALAFSCRIDDILLKFAQNEAGEIYDHNTGTRWNLMGEAVAGTLAGSQLTYLPSGVTEWYAWAAYYPQTMIYGGSMELTVDNTL